MDYHTALEWLNGHYNLEAIAAGSARRRPTLERISALVHALGDPHRAFPAIHITGTNGKGSTAHLIASALTAHGLRVGLATSPNLHTVRERLRISGTPIGCDDFADVLGKVAAAEQRSGVDANYFEIRAAAAFLWFARSGVDIAVVEVGAGGRHDATNVIDAEVAVVTNVGLDHAHLFGPTLLDIANEKAGIVKPGATLVLGPFDDRLVEPFLAAQPSVVLRAGRDFVCLNNELAATGRRVDLESPSVRLAGVDLRLHGLYQCENAATALAAVDAFLGPHLRESAVRDGFAATRHPGRFEIVCRDPIVVLDGAHNRTGAIAVTDARKELHRGDFVLVVGMNRDRDALELLEALEASKARLVVTCAANWPKSVAAHTVSEAAGRLGANVECVPSVAAAVERGLAVANPADLVLVAGSLYVIAEAREALGITAIMDHA